MAKSVFSFQIGDLEVMPQVHHLLLQVSAMGDVRQGLRLLAGLIGRPLIRQLLPDGSTFEGKIPIEPEGHMSGVVVWSPSSEHTPALERGPFYEALKERVPPGTLVVIDGFEGGISLVVRSIGGTFFREVPEPTVYVPYTVNFVPQHWILCWAEKI